MVTNKGLRNEIQKLKHIKICKILGINHKIDISFRQQRKPCSCYMCSPYKFSRNIKHKNRWSD